MSQVCRSRRIGVDDLLVYSNALVGTMCQTNILLDGNVSLVPLLTAAHLFVQFRLMLTTGEGEKPAVSQHRQKKI